jgi:TPR repeat protein
VFSLSSITLLIAPFAAQAESHADAKPTKAQGLRAWKRGDHAMALIALRPIAEDGDPQAQNAVGEILLAAQSEAGQLGMLQPGGVRRNNEATTWFRKAAFQGYARAQVNLGFMIERDNGAFGLKEAASWYYRAARQEYAAGQHHFARLCASGRGMSRDIPQAVYWYTKAIHQNFAASQVAFGLMRRDGIGIFRNSAEAVRLFRLAAEQGMADAQFYLGMMYAAGEGVAKDYVEAMHWYRQAAAQELDEAREALEDIVASVDQRAVASRRPRLI